MHPAATCSAYYLAVQDIPHTQGVHKPHIRVSVTRTFHTLWDCLISLVRHISAINYRQKSLQNSQRDTLRQVTNNVSSLHKEINKVKTEGLQGHVPTKLYSITY